MVDAAVFFRYVLADWHCVVVAHFMGYLVANLHRSIMAVPKVWCGDGEIFYKVYDVINLALAPYPCAEAPNAPW